MQPLIIHFFFKENTDMLLGDAKSSCDKLNQLLGEL